MQDTIRDECCRAPVVQISAIGETLADKAGPPKHRTWVKHPAILTFADGRLKAGASNLFIASWTKLLNEISLPVRAVTECFLRKLGNVRFEL